MRSTVIVAAASKTASIAAHLAERRGHAVRLLETLSDNRQITRAIDNATAIILVPGRGDAEPHADHATRTLIRAATGHAPDAHLVLVSSFAVGYGQAHPFNRVTRTFHARLTAEQLVRDSGLAWTIIRPTWLTDDPLRAHALTLTQDRCADGMLSRSDLAATLVAATEHRAARNTTFALYNEPGQPSRRWSDMFAMLTHDRGRAA